MTPGFGVVHKTGGVEGLEFVDELKRDISSYLLKGPEGDEEDDLLACLGGTLCYASPEDSGDDKWYNARATSKLLEELAAVGTSANGTLPGNHSISTAGLKQAHIFGAPPHSSSIRWPERPEELAGNLRCLIASGGVSGLGDHSDSGPSDSGESCDSEVGLRRSRVAPRRRGSSLNGHARADRDDSWREYVSCDPGNEPFSPGLNSCGSGSQERLRGSRRRDYGMMRERSNCSPLGRPHRSSSSSGAPSPELRSPTPQVNMDELLEFTSCFESSNLQYALYNVEDEAYDLVLENDVHTRGHTQWFYFAVRNGRRGQTVRFRIVNMSKAKSLFRLGMKPVVWSEACSFQTFQAAAFCGAAAGGSTSACVASELWRPCTDAVQYHRSRIGAGRYYTLAFEYTFERSEDSVFIAYCVPFTYSMLRKSLSAIAVDPVAGPWCRTRSLCSTLGNVQCDLLEISNWAISRRSKKVVVVSSRVHPGESNASWLVHGLISFLLSPSHEAHVLRDNFVWKIVPMLNPDGVICGNYRCGLCGVDLNRQWRRPHQDLHGTVYKVKKLIQSIKKKANLCMYLDLHGHSRKCGVFSYACGNFPKEDFRRYTVRMYPKLLSMLMPEFVFPHCRWRVGKGKRGTGRVVVSKDLGLTNTYTIEASFFGAAAAPEKEEASEQTQGRPESDAKPAVDGDELPSGGTNSPDGCGPAEPEEAPQRIVLFTPSKLELFGANLARALILQQNLGPAVMMMQRRAAACRLDGGQDAARYWTPPGMRGEPKSSTPSESGSATGSGASGEEESEFSDAACGDEASRPRVKRTTSPPSPGSPLSPKTPPNGGRRASRRSKTEHSDVTPVQDQPHLTPESWKEDVDMKPYLGISVPEVLQDLQNSQSALAADETEGSSSGSDSQPSGDNLAPQDLARLAKIFSQKRKTAKRASDGGGSRGANVTVCGAAGCSPNNGRISGNGPGETARARTESNGATRSKWRNQKNEPRGRRDYRVPGVAGSRFDKDRQQPPRADMHRTVAFGQTTYVVSSTGSPTPHSTASPLLCTSAAIGSLNTAPPATSPSTVSPLSPTRDCQSLSFFGDEKAGLAGSSERERVRWLAAGWSAAQWPAIPPAPTRPAPGRGEVPQGGLNSSGNFGNGAGGAGAHSEASVLLGTPPKDRFAFPQGSFTQQGGGFAQGGVFPVQNTSGSTRRSLPPSGTSRLPVGSRLTEDVNRQTLSRLYMRNASSTMLQWQRQYASAPLPSSQSSPLGLSSPPGSSAQGGGHSRSGDAMVSTPPTGSAPVLATGVAERAHTRLLGSSGGQRPGSRPGTASARSMQRSDGSMQTVASAPAAPRGEVGEPFPCDVQHFPASASDGPSSARQRPARTPSMPPAVGHDSTSTLPHLDSSLRQELLMYIKRF